MDRKNNFALVRKPSSAIEKAAPGAKRILSSMVTDALMLAKKPEFIALMCDDQISDTAEMLIKSDWDQKYMLRFIRFHRATELLKLSREQPFDLIFMYVGNVDWDIGSGHRFGAAAELLGQLKAEHGKPIIATQGMELTECFAGTGVTFIEAPWSLETFRNALETTKLGKMR
jgi:hypothetical protein